MNHLALFKMRSKIVTCMTNNSENSQYDFHLAPVQDAAFCAVP